MYLAKNEKISVEVRASCQTPPSEKLILVEILEEATKLGKDYYDVFYFLEGPHRLVGRFQARIFDEFDWLSCLITPEPETPKAPRPNHKKKKVIGI